MSSISNSIPSLPLAKGENSPLTTSHLVSTDEALRRMRSAKTLQELFAIYQAALPADKNDDFLMALDQNRSGERQLFPPELKGVTW